MSPNTTRVPQPRKLADHSADRRMIMLVVAASLIGTGAAFGAWLLIRLIAVATNLFWFGRLSAAPADIVDAHIGLA
ncbi:MAG: chloride channel protein, partial [Pseudomonadota bacterium]|nr:chloride channel protein [Pseudomonadota bacterium]